MPVIQTSVNPYDESDARHWAWQRGYEGLQIGGPGIAVCVDEAHAHGKVLAREDAKVNEVRAVAEIDVFERAIEHYGNNGYVSLVLVLKDLKEGKF